MFILFMDTDGRPQTKGSASTVSAITCNQPKCMVYHISIKILRLCMFLFNYNEGFSDTNVSLIEL